MDTHSFSGQLLSTGSQSVRPFSLHRRDKPSSGSTTYIRKVSRRKRKNVRARDRRATTIDILPGNVLLEIFDFYRITDDKTWCPVWGWYLLVHVCRRWRQIVFASPRRLDLRILCTHTAAVRKDLGIWPTLPIVMQYLQEPAYLPLVGGLLPDDEHNAVAALEHPDRVCDIRFGVTGSQLGKMAAVMQVPFPVLTRLFIVSKDRNSPTVPGGFLGGSAPCLQEIRLERISFPSLPTLLLSASDLVELSLREIPPSGYISPQAIVRCLAAIPRLQDLVIGFQVATSHPDRIRPPLITRIVLPALTSFQFLGAGEYLEDLVARIDSPQLDRMHVNYFNQMVDFQVAELSKFTDRSVGPKLMLFKRAKVFFSRKLAYFTMYRHANHPPSDLQPLWTTISCQGIDWQVFHIAQVLSHFSATLSTVVHLELAGLQIERQIEARGMDEVEWLHLFHQFPTVRTIQVSENLARHAAHALENITPEAVTEVLPSLALIWLGGQRAPSVKKFIASRRLSGRPVTIVSTLKEFNERLKSFIGKGENVP